MTVPTQYSGVAADRLQIFISLLRKWNAAINLVSPGTLSDVWTRHVGDSAQVLENAPSQRRRWLDVGAGAGFPGIVVALLAADTSDPVEMSMIEADQRKAAFLATVSRETGVPMKVYPKRIEETAPQNAEIVSARALAPLGKLCSYAHRHLAPEGAAIFLKGGQHDMEVAEARRLWAFDLEVRTSRTNPTGSILILKGLQRV